MKWTAYRVVFKLKSPMHIGCGKVGNVQRTRPYVTGRVFWGALTMRLTREQHQPATDSRQYEEMGNKVHEELAYSYFYPATCHNATYQIEYPWDNESRFRRRFLSSYASTALVYPQHAADEGLLHEVEFLSPRTLDTGEQVYLVGYVFEKEGCSLNWKEACQKLQMGGERGYGWGDLGYIESEEITDTQFFNPNSHWREQDGSIVIQVSESGHLLAHTVAQNVSVHGEIEPLVGREWRSHNSTNRYAGQHLEKFCDPCWIPGSKVRPFSAFVIQKFGIWQVKG
ncbi:hypothetical protein Cylst_6365 (plasmid) [Cylindrospermum stagnale PCC 7417]|uniref:RAMP superfamily protein probably involved in DNA repair n=1 Tax=Cylindrospermum stagnale PCC 7417 TaxID=56107 RepID=K9X7I9_9NOST|nr:hypothetical protein [Cylindrospermum stagnale]AFZ28585.1 hypothetical protein Cylst_6365 [Cylindrospermum stagnale PCC 7417]